MLGIYASIFLLLLVTVLICAVCSCASVSRGDFPETVGGNGGGGFPWKREEEEEEAMSLVRPSSCLVFPLSQGRF